MPESNSPNHAHEVVIVGGGAGGTAVAARLRRLRPATDVVIIEPQEQHYYQPGWTLVGGGAMPQSDTVRPRARCMPEDVAWLRDSVVAFEPDANRVQLASGETVEYVYLVVAAGIQLDWDAIDGLSETLGRNGVTSNYRFDLAPYTSQLGAEIAGGELLFTQPAMPIKCAGAPQKILYLTADRLRRRNVSANIHFYNQGISMFGVPLFAKALEGVMDSYGAERHYKYDLVAVDGERRLATFRTADGGTVSRHFDMLHVCPPQSAPDFIKRSPLANEAGWMSVDPHRLRHTRYANIYGLGDCTSTPNAKTAAAVRQQFPVVVAGILADMGQGTQVREYDGYGSCPLTTSLGKVMLAEFRYDGEVVPSFPLDPTVPTRFYWFIKRRVLPWLYWDVMLKGQDLRYPRHRPRPNLILEKA